MIDYSQYNNQTANNILYHDIYKTIVNNEFIANIAEKFNVAFDKIKADIDKIVQNNPESIEEDDFLENLESVLENMYSKIEKQEVIVDIPEYEFKFTITYDDQYKISIQDKKTLFPCKKPLLEFDRARDNNLVEFIVMNTALDEDQVIDINKAKELVNRLNQKIASDEISKKINKLKFKEVKTKTPNTYLGKVVSAPFEVIDNKLYINKIINEDSEPIKNLISRAFIVKSVGEIKDKGDFESIRYAELAWIDIDGNEKTMIIQENYILDSILQRDNLKQLSIVGTRRCEVIDYYCKLLENNDIDILEITKIGGWKDNFTRYVTADNTYGSTKDYMLFENESMENVHKNGTFNDWIEGVYELLNDEIFAFITYTGVCALIQSPLNIPNHTIVASNPTSTGKTTGGRIRSSIYGNPFYMTMTSNSSKLGNVNTISAYNDVTCHLDEIKKEDIPMIRALIYNHSSGMPRKIATKYGGVKNNKYEIFSNNIIVTTEETILNESAKGGQLVRVIPILRTPKSNPEGIRKFEKLVCSKNKVAKNYGHALEPLVLKIMEMIQDGTLEKRYVEIENELRSYNVSNSNMINRLIEIYTAIALAGEIFNEAIVNHPENRGRIQALNPIEITKQMMQDYMEQEPDKSEGVKAIEVIIDWYNGNKFKFNEPPQIPVNLTGEIEYRDQVVEFYGYDEGETIDIFKYKVKEVLTKADFVPDTVFKAWNNEGYTECKKGRNDKDKKLKKEHYEMLKNDERLQKLIGKGASTHTISIKKSMVNHLLIEDKKPAKPKEIIPPQYTEEEWNLMKNKESPKIHIEQSLDKFIELDDDNTASA